MIFKCYFKQTKDMKLIKKLHKKAFPGEDVRDFTNDIVWMVTDTGHKEVGFCSVSINEHGEGFLSRCAIFDKGHGFHRAAIGHRLRWLKRHGVNWCVTYVHEENYSSIANLIKCGFEIYKPENDYAGKGFIYFRKELK